MEKSYRGIDVSRWQGDIDWTAVKATGIDFVMVRAGYCGYAGDITRDVKFASNLSGALEAGLEVGVYLYSYAKTPAAAKAAARELQAVISGYSLTYPVAFDIEDTLYASMTKAENTAITKAFLAELAAGGYCPMLYSYKSFAEYSLNMSELAEYDFWLAHVTAQTNYAGDYTMWQYSWTGTVDGISTDVDLNYCYKNYPVYIRENGLNGFEADDGRQPGDPEPDEGSQSGDEDGAEDTGPDDQETPAGGSTYVVAKGDTLTHIARRNGVALQALIQANPQIKNPNLIYVGDVIQIPSKAGE